MDGVAASILEAHRHSVFVEVIIGSGPCHGLTYTITSTGMVCVFNDSTKMMTKHVQLESTNGQTVAAFCMELFCAEETPGLLVIGVTNGGIRCFAPLSLSFIANLPLPAPLPQPLSSVSGPVYPACYALRKVPGTRLNPVPKLAAVYADRSLIIWDIADVYNVLRWRSFLYHAACIWDVGFLDNYFSNSKAEVQRNASEEMPRGTLVTCSADGTVRLWNNDLKAQRKSKFRSVFSKEMLHLMRFNSNDVRNVPENESVDDEDVIKRIEQLSYAKPESEMPVRLICEDSPRCLAVHPYGHRLGNISVASQSLRIMTIFTPI